MLVKADALKKGQPMKGMHIKLTPYQLLILLFWSIISLGTILLKSSWATTVPISWLDALFTTTSAMTVTGLVVVDTPETYTLFGEIVIMLLIQLGGLGIMSFAMFVYIIIGRKIGLKQRLIVQTALNQNSMGGVIRLVKILFVFSIAVELIAAFFLSIRWIPDLGWREGIYFSVFHSVSAFNNAGFALWSDNLMGYVGDPLINIVITSLIIIGGIGFTVLADIWYKKSYKKLSLHTKIMIIGTLVINVIAMLAIFALEYTNVKTLGSLSSTGDKLWGSYFQAVTHRTAGFNTLDIAGLNESTVFLMLILMFVGAGSASTGGGIKLTTFIVILLAVGTFLKGKREIVIANRSIDHFFVFRALAISTISLLFIVVVVFILMITEGAQFLTILYEVISAFGTVGLSRGLTADLTEVGKVIIIFMMFLGKIGPLTLMFSLSKHVNEKVSYPKGDVLIG